ncbi:DNA-binding transcriptional LysR family regulator [Sulfitobacter undariae]|uniref:DNA-binding transcriptional LysR family regulator n=1 Tax=Sulfitobacter undariae TaxID=1563671 RepID=A0A7W6GYU3_9RHOB|nr:LysR family transcriptional regulator [Sulfitobacter undariae]MBB3992795.1 DNA-binding transcriptional LysR family regulator [Sulfitobacter undariae]
MLNATWLETFTTLCQIGHFTKTADRLGMTQPGVSQHLRKLETQVGKPLILQEGKSFTLTSAGSAVLEVGKARRTQERALRESIEVDDPNVGDVRIGCSGSMALWTYPHLLAHMKHAPDLCIHLTAAPQASIVAGVLKDALDLGIISEKSDHPRLHATPLAREELCLVLPARFDATNLSLDRLNTLGFVAHPDGFSYADDLLSLNFGDTYKGADFLRVRTFINQIGQIPAPVAEGLGYTILPKSGVDAFARQQDLAIVPLPKRRFHDLWLIARQRRSSFARIAALKDLLERTTQSLQ